MNAHDASIPAPEDDPWETASSALFNTSSEKLRLGEPDELRKFIDQAILDRIDPLSWVEFVQTQFDPARPRPFVYDRAAQLVFVGGFGVHETIAAGIYATRRVDRIGDWADLCSMCMDTHRSDYSDQFVLEGMGFISGGPSAQMGNKTLMLGKGVRMTPAERQVFRDYARMVI